MHDNIPLISALFIRQGVPPIHLSAKPGPIPHLSALHIQQIMPPLQPIDVHAHLPHPISTLLQVLGVPPHKRSSVREYAPCSGNWK